MDPSVVGSNDPEAHQKEVVSSITEFETALRKDYPIVWAATMSAPLVISLVLLAVLGAAYGWEYPGKLVSHALLTFFVFGRFIILSGTEAANGVSKVLLSPEELFGLVTYLDFITALFVTFHMGVLFRLPYVGPKIAMLVGDGKFVMDSFPKVKRAAFLGLVILVIFPSSTTGSIGGSIFGRLLGLSRLMTISGVLLGSVLGNGLMYVMSNQLNKWISKDDIWLKVVGAILVVLFCVVLEWRYRQIKKKYDLKQTDPKKTEDE